MLALVSLVSPTTEKNMLFNVVCVSTEHACIKAQSQEFHIVLK